MKKYYGVMMITLMFLTFFVGCGYDTKDWPRITFPFERSQITEVSIDYKKQPEGIEDNLRIVEIDAISELYANNDGYPYRKSIAKKVDTKNYLEKVEVKFFYQVDEVIQEYSLTYYGYGIANGIIILDNGEAHFLPGDFVSGFYRYSL